MTAVVRKVSKRERESILEATLPEWKRLLKAGDMVVVDKRPNWSIHEDTILKSKKVEDGVAVWLEPKPAMQAIADEAAAHEGLEAAEEAGEAEEETAATRGSSDDDAVERALSAVKEQTDSMPTADPETAAGDLVGAAAGIFGDVEEAG